MIGSTRMKKSSTHVHRSGSQYFARNGKLLMVFFHDGGQDIGGIEEVVVIDVPDELGKYFVGLMDEYIE